MGWVFQVWVISSNDQISKQREYFSNLSNLFSYYQWICLGYSFLASCLVIKGAIMLIRITVQSTKNGATSALKTCEPHSFPALVPLFEELRESRQRIPQTVLPCFYALDDALQSANKLLQMCHSGSKLYLVLERQAVAEQFQKVTDYLSQTLDALPYAKLDISDEVREQVELLHNQLTRAKGRVDSHELQLYTDLVSVLRDKDNEPAGVAALQRLAQKLELKTSGAIRQENRALQEMMLEKDNQLDGCESDMNFPELFSVCRKLTSILPPEDGEDSDTPELDRVNIAAGVFTPKPGPTKHDEVRVGSGPEKRALYGNETNAGEKAGHPAIPDDFKCPISLEMMKDPVIVATGQVSFLTSCNKHYSFLHLFHIEQLKSGEHSVLETHSSFTQ